MDRARSMSLIDHTFDIWNSYVHLVHGKPVQASQFDFHARENVGTSKLVEIGMFVIIPRMNFGMRRLS